MVSNPVTRPRRTHRLLGTAAASIAALALARPALACSVCRCGDPAFNALGLNIYAAGSFRLAFDWERFEKSQATEAEPGRSAGSESLREDRLTATFSVTPAERVTLLVRVPFADRTVTSSGPGAASDVQTGRGLADPEIFALVRLWAAPFRSGLGRRAWVGLQLGVKTPWGENGLRSGGVRLDEHAQPGTGSTDVTAGLSGVVVLDLASSLFGSVSEKQTGSNRFGYRYGSAAQAAFGYERRLTRALDGVLELDVRDARRDRVDASGALDPNTGGSLVYLAPRLTVTLTDRLVGRLGVQIPVANLLNGSQTERTVYGIGLTYLFSN